MNAELTKIGVDCGYLHAGKHSWGFMRNPYLWANKVAILVRASGNNDIPMIETH